MLIISAAKTDLDHFLDRCINPFLEKLPVPLTLIRTSAILKASLIPNSDKIAKIFFATLAFSCIYNELEHRYEKQYPYVFQVTNIFTALVSPLTFSCKELYKSAMGYKDAISASELNDSSNVKKDLTSYVALVALALTPYKMASYYTQRVLSFRN
ncbi:MAG: hypothetical protein QRY71_03955 [Candidatus Rhabdochlamydia sp.]